MLLSEYHPSSCLEVPKTSVPTPRFPVLDVHTHWGKVLLGENFEMRYDTCKIVHALQACGVTKVVNLDFGYGNTRDRILRKFEGYEDFFLNFGNVDLTKLDEPDFEKYVYHSISEGVQKGMCGLKFFKTDTGLELKDHAGKYVTADDPRLRCVYETAAAFHLPVLMHFADPVAFFTPIDGKNERYEELSGHPDWGFCKDGYYTFQQLMEAQENLISSQKNTTFIIAHFGSYSENIRQVGIWLDRYPNMNIDIAARISELGRQPYSAKAFLEKYADRILFGTDYFPITHIMHPNYYRFLETFDEYFNPDGEGMPYGQGRWNIYGIGLSDQTLEKIYHKNAEKILGL